MREEPVLAGAEAIASDTRRLERDELYRRLEVSITGADHESISARWEFGRELASEKNAKTGKLPDGVVGHIAVMNETNVREIQRRLKVFEKFASIEALRARLEHDRIRSWDQVINEVLPERKPEREPVVCTRSDSFTLSEHARIIEVNRVMRSIRQREERYTGFIKTLLIHLRAEVKRKTPQQERDAA